MNIRFLSLAVLLFIASNSSLASAQLIGGIRQLPPAYLRVPQWQKCVASMTCGSAQFVCLPNVKPAGCPDQSWKLLTGKRLITDCIAGCKGFS
jgi:hypothetical protein